MFAMSHSSGVIRINPDVIPINPGLSGLIRIYPDSSGMKSYSSGMKRVHPDIIRILSGFHPESIRISSGMKAHPEFIPYKDPHPGIHTSSGINPD